ncbi:hypothetical protein QAD02_002827 [Eretmocerus hayati]|uniref:Uncharacterized protein n=1 Tax=Eretmocerus hayati TaxID=131215 RepID=A0ACC2NL92_9HYME|nr:hypothetical protein QAD02_002827 [Eretmocerus hayati]
MANNCIVCEKQSSGRESRSYHKFPSKHEPGQAWLEALSLSKCGSHSRFCSDHFDPSCFHDTGGYTTIRRLEKVAVPSIIMVEDSVANQSAVNENASENTDTNGMVLTPNENTCDESANINAQNTSSLGGGDSMDVDHFMPNDLPSTVPESSASQDNMSISPTKKNLRRKLVDKATPPNGNNDVTDDHNIHTEQYLNSSDGEKNLKRCPREEISIADQKKFRDYCRKNFDSDESWEFFQEYVRHRGRVIVATRMKSIRRDKKIVNLHQLIEKLKSENMDAIAEYLQELPPRLRELVERIKEKKTTQAYTPHLKNFARALHF